MTAWKPKSDHVSQLQVNPTTGALDGRDDCGPACLVRYLREYGKLPLGGAVSDQLNTLREIFSGLPDEPGQAGTSITDLEQVLRHYSLPGSWTTSFAEAQAAQMSVVLVHAGPQPAQYPAGWLGAQDHWILWLPQWDGKIDWFNDPLAYTNGQKDCEYDLTSVQSVFLGAILLAPLADAPIANAYYTLRERAGLKVQPNHVCSALAQIPAGEKVISLRTGRVVNGESWSRVEYNQKQGWIPTSKLKGVIQ